VNLSLTNAKRLVLDYFYDFYIHGLIMAKNWGREMTDMQMGRASASTSPGWSVTENPATPSFYLNLPSSPILLESSVLSNVSNPPTHLCNWTIHVPVAIGEVDCENASAELPHAQTINTSFTDELRQSIASSSFTRNPPENLPLAQDTILRAIENEPRAMELDAWKFAIMAGNSKLLSDLGRKIDERPEGINDLYPFHLSAAFLDGGHACCEVFTTLTKILGPTYAFHHDVDNFGHTILDALMVSILRSHTSISPDAVSYGFRSPYRFPGEEMDICGRWGPGTPRIRDLFRQGFSRIPIKWKHQFCHTAVQAICHSIVTVYGSPSAPDINKRSGLFIRRCTECGMELKPGPLHTLIIITFYLAELGMTGETLFGALAVLVCLLSMGADVSFQATISVEEILKTSEGGKCHHTSLTPLELMQQVPGNIIDGWSDSCRVGWNCFARVLIQAEEHNLSSRDKMSDSGDERESAAGLDHDEELSASDFAEQYACDLTSDIGGSPHTMLKLKCHDGKMGLLWATIQTELLTYRRINDGDPWVSAHFSLKALEAWLMGRSADFLTPLVEDRMMQKHSQCGWFHRAESLPFPAAQDVSARYFMNMDIYDRATFIDVPDEYSLWLKPRLVLG
jgi:hypothetical protein